MSQFPTTKNATLIGEALGAIGISAEDDSVRRLDEYAAEIIRWGRRVNLTGAKSVAEFIRGPLFDALTVVPLLERGTTLVDIGSGGGLPGIPASILDRDARITLVEPRERRAAFLRHVVHLLGVRAEVVQSRAENLPVEPWRGAVSQAVWPPIEWLDRAVTLIERGGAVYVLAAESMEAENLSGGASIDEQRSVARPWNGVTRYAARIRFG